MENRSDSFRAGRLAGWPSKQNSSLYFSKKVGCGGRERPHSAGFRQRWAAWQELGRVLSLLLGRGWGSPAARTGQAVPVAWSGAATLLSLPVPVLLRQGWFAKERSPSLMVQQALVWLPYHVQTKIDDENSSAGFYPGRNRGRGTSSLSYLVRGFSSSSKWFGNIFEKLRYS